MIQRIEYLNQLISGREKQIIKVVTGVRRCGKSTLFTLYIDFLKSAGVSEEQIVSINLEDVEHEKLLNYKALYDYVKERLCEDRYTYVFIDEVQNCKSFEKAVNSLFIKPNVDVYITGSNAYMLSGELATLLSGRYITIDMLPLSFKEYCESSCSAGKTIPENFNDYLRFGSFPYIAMIERRDTVVRPYLEGIYSTILLKDVAKREGITDVSLLENIIKFVAASVGSPISSKKISDTINSSGRKISVNTVEHYLRALTDSYIFYKVERYDIKGKQHLKTLGKYYLVDSGIRNLLLSTSSSDLGHMIENVVYLELLRRGSKVNIGKLYEKEVDFIASDMNGRTYYQVSASVLDESTLNRELEPLRKIADNYPKILLTLDDIGVGRNFAGIRHLNLLDWLQKAES
ncbi:ATP-binding protein [Desulfosporosinus meridiei]|uniref:Putative ATPase (AAA+ superfamily) n=1 Tax=Desulfosporosinus meridiei (strain ATCC BAA-275 / DSM 13257 / KCTC 12902 / NCIMB 13706 / S10) TaxID=768704 RepID=J7J504_DESMD|nr:ATP-binding protein [Desulfosporosinus meridiei]AFQ46036.1 putative ATPase (AAA+ superfamily) [Desulfosporosinus meridiei DSM 13257]